MSPLLPSTVTSDTQSVNGGGEEVLTTRDMIFDALPLPHGCWIFAIALLVSCAHAPKEREIAQLSAKQNSASSKPDAWPDNWHDRGVQHYLRGDYPRAIHAFEMTTLVDNGGDEERNDSLLYYSYLATGDFENALRVANQIVRTRPFHATSYQYVGLAELWLGHARQARDQFDRAKELDSRLPRLHFYSGLADAALGGDSQKAFRRAETEYLEILRANPKDFTANYELAALYLFWNRNVESVKPLLVTAKENRPQSPDEDVASETRLFAEYYLPVQEGILAYRQGKTRQSLKLLTATLTSAPSGARPDIAEILFYMGKSNAELGDATAAEQFFEKSLALDPKGPYALDAARSRRNLASRGSTSP